MDTVYCSPHFPFSVKEQMVKLYKLRKAKNLKEEMSHLTATNLSFITLCGFRFDPRLVQ